MQPDTLNFIEFDKLELDSSNNTIYVTEYEERQPIPDAFQYTFPHVDFTNNQAIDDSSKWFPTMFDIYDMLDSITHERRPDMFIWAFVHKKLYDHFIIYDWGFSLDYQFKDNIYGGFILNGKPVIVIIGDSLYHRQEIENMFIKRADSITVKHDYEFVPNTHTFGIDLMSEVIGVYQDSVLVPYYYNRDFKRVYTLNDSISKYLENKNE